MIKADKQDILKHFPHTTHFSGKKQNKKQPHEDRKKGWVYLFVRSGA